MEVALALQFLLQNLVFSVFQFNNGACARPRVAFDKSGPSRTAWQQLPRLARIAVKLCLESTSNSVIILLFLSHNLLLLENSALSCEEKSSHYCSFNEQPILTRDRRIHNFLSMSKTLKKHQNQNKYTLKETLHQRN